MTTLGTTSDAGLLVERCDVDVPMEQAVVTFSQQTAPAVLESSQHQEDNGRFSILAFDPIEEFHFPSGRPGNAFRALAERSAMLPRVGPSDSPCPFPGGWIGYFSYEAGHVLENLPLDRCKIPLLPLAFFRLYDTAAVFDHREDQWYAYAVDWPKTFDGQPLAARQRIAKIRTLLERAQSSELLPSPTIDHQKETIPNMSRSEYIQKFAAAMRYIERGDVYQVNLTQRFTTRWDLSSLDLYRRLRHCNPAAFSAFLPFDGGAVLSSSPELFLHLQDGKVVTRPIKGTRPRLGNRSDDTAARRELLCSEKEHAELNMIIDLLRNDLGRVCEYGSVVVRQAGAIEEHPGLFHRVAEIEGTVRGETSWVDLLEATFPGGSITGAPKIRAMQIIEELEPTTRDVYCGSIGMIGLDGSLKMNIAIRTMLHIDHDVHFCAGGAIVADSTPEDEYNETLAKARGMMLAVGCLDPTRQPSVEEVAAI